MNQMRDIDLVDDLKGRSAEASWVEYKRDNSRPDMIGARCSALSNAARLEGKDFGYMLWGIDDATHEVVGTRFDPDATKVGNIELSFWLAKELKPSIAFSFRAIDHPRVGHVPTRAWIS